ncbi:MAG TPA: carboxypeptidase regulatory-like domain-containing protein, partial [Pyrinomonadaceae bacterium]|nr:carboxypeptidase regulatory-like domain-containing protein [Pyrinomonadaceae bacterium]
PVAENSGGAGTSYVATVSKIGNASAGGNVFELGGHDYDISNNGNTAIQRANGERMMLNTLLVPAFRAGCPGVSFNSVKAFKSVKMFTDINSDGLPNFGDTVEWTLRYINEGTSTVTNFQITDPIDAKLTYVAGSISAIASPNPATTVGVNGSYNPNTNINMLVPATSKIGPNGIITVKFRTVVNGFGLIANQGTGTGTGITGSVKTDTTDSTTTGTVANYPIACPVTPCLSQAGYQTGSNEDPTKFDLGTAPSAGPALVSGKVLDEGGRGLRSVSVVLQNASTGAVRSAVTNTFGNFSFAEVPAGDLYIISVSSKRYVFAPDSIAFQVNDNVAGLTFNVAPTGPVIQLPTVGKTAAAVPAKVSKY